MNMPLLVDCHTHTHYSDGASTLKENFDAARACGLSVIACTDHLTLPQELDPVGEVSVSESDLPLLLREVASLREQYPDLEIIQGFECDYYPGCEENIARWSKGATFLLGSVHMLDSCWIDDPADLSYWDTHSTQFIWEYYFETWAQACFSPAHFHSMAHPDLVMLFGRCPSDEIRRKLYKDAALAAAEAHVHIEINTSGRNKALKIYYPHEELLREFCQAKVPITVGSDAHVSTRIGDHIREAYAFAYNIGYKSIDVPQIDGSWRTIEL
ncbi:MAG: histidinol-phosphatase HisJ family protein [Coriobacteriales bacterium]|nr:histidinol-phosphatase HisJ family protein [Coriobacteriales bacterium]